MATGASFVPFRGRISVTFGRPSVMVPVLSMTTVSMAWAVSRASPDLMRIPFSAPLPVPTMMATGVARPRAHGREDDQDGDGRREGEFGVDAHDEVPDEACNDGDGDDGRDEVTRNGIGHLGDRCLAGTGFIDELDDLADRRVVADAAGCDVDETRLVCRSRRDFIADLFFYRDAFASNGGFIDAGRPFRNDTVCRDAFTRTDDDFIADDEVFDGNDRFDAVAQDRGLFGARSINFSMAVLVLPLARASRYLPTSMRVTIIPADSKYRLVLYWATRAQSPWPIPQLMRKMAKTPYRAAAMEPMPTRLSMFGAPWKRLRKPLI